MAHSARHEGDAEVEALAPPPTTLALDRRRQLVTRGIHGRLTGSQDQAASHRCARLPHADTGGRNATWSRSSRSAQARCTRRARPRARPEQHDAEARLADSSRWLRDADLGGGFPGQPDGRLDGRGVGLHPVHRQREPKRQPAGPPGQVVGVVGRVPLARGLSWMTSGRTRPGCAPSGPAPGPGRAARRSRTVRTATCRSNDERVGVLDAVIAAPDARREQPAPPYAPSTWNQSRARGRLRPRRPVVRRSPSVRGARGGHHGGQRPGSAVGRDGRAQRGAGEPVVAGRHHQRVHLQDAQRVADRGVRVGADRHPPAPRNRRPDTGRTRLRLATSRATTSADRFPAEPPRRNSRPPPRASRPGRRSAAAPCSRRGSRRPPPARRCPGSTRTRSACRTAARPWSARPG